MVLDEAIEHLQDQLKKPVEHFCCIECKREHERLLKMLIALKEKTGYDIEN